jgi:hypothetical protein
MLMSEVGSSDSAFAGAGSKVPAMGTVKSIAAARKAVREASAEAQQERARRERDNIEDLATYLVAGDRLAAVDDWEAEKVAGIAAAAAQRRDEHRGVAADAICRIRERGVTVADIAKLASIAESGVQRKPRVPGFRGTAGMTPASEQLTMSLSASRRASS